MTYLLAYLVVLIWGVILQRVLNQVNTEEKSTVTQYVNNHLKEKLPSMQPDTFSLLLNYPDPFLKGEVHIPQEFLVSTDLKQSAKSNSLEATLTQNNMPNKQSATEDQITYLGFIQNPTSGKRIAIINYNSRETMLSENESFGKITLVHILDGAVKIKVGKEFKHIKQSL